VTSFEAIGKAPGENLVPSVGLTSLLSRVGAPPILLPWKLDFLLPGVSLMFYLFLCLLAAPSASPLCLVHCAENKLLPQSKKWQREYCVHLNSDFFKVPTPGEKDVLFAYLVFTVVLTGSVELIQSTSLTLQVV
jgi:hypothetical protein